ncbi:MAG: Stk1 family PASTA domain-containing Ser/Thr kinase [Acidimicrobiia bacterium]|nr:Stk1 family PASTA domain-containing Ser/Thr kinase [Acidimicrobiia bacterium]NNJ46456.1 Stk1 family PASTA domain-containing Ser/Thr kinase [Acidimicrobiia bacterium]
MPDMNTTVLAERYRLTNHLARGGMADVYAAVDEVLGRKVAVKMLHANYATDAAFIQRFRREAQAAANLTHPNIVSIYDTGKDGGHYYIVMELVEGKTLRDVLRSDGPLLPRRAAEIASEVAAALSVAARGGLAHRDVKPGNILLTETGSVKVTDFGIARAWDDSEELTRTGAVIGTATYFSPEQAQGQPADGRSDLYALGVVLFEMLTGRPPFSGETPVSVAYQHVSEAVSVPSNSNPDVPPELDAIVMRALQKNPTSRYQTAEEMRGDLLRFLGGLPVGAADPEAATRVVAATPPPTVPPAETYRQMTPLPPERRTPWSVIIGSLLLLAVVVVAGISLVDGLTSTDPNAGLVEMPNLLGSTEAQAIDELQELDLRFELSDRPSDEFAEGIVSTTEPAAGVLVDSQDRVLLVISSGAETFTVPIVEGRDVEAAQLALADADFIVRLESVTDDEIVAGQVISQNPPAGTNHPPGTEVVLVVSAGPEQVVLSEYTGFTAIDALAALSNLGVQTVLEKEFHPTIPDGEVIRTDPPALSIIPKSQVVKLIVSLGIEPVAVPSLIGNTQAEAQNALTALGLSIAFGDPIEVGADSGQEGLVLAQSTPATVLVEPGTTITVQIGEVPPPPTTTTTVPPTTTTTAP